MLIACEITFQCACVDTTHVAVSPAEVVESDLNQETNQVCACRPLGYGFLRLVFVVTSDSKLQVLTMSQGIFIAKSIFVYFEIFIPSPKLSPPRVLLTVVGFPLS